MTVKVLAEELSNELGLDAELIERVIKSEFKLVRDEMRSGDWNGVKLQYLGKFAVKPNRMKYVIKYEHSQQERVHNEGNTKVPPAIDGEGSLVENSV